MGFNSGFKGLNMTPLLTGVVLATKGKDIYSPTKSTKQHCALTPALGTDAV